MRKLLVFLATGVFALGMAGAANAAALNWAGTATFLWDGLAPGILPGGGVATINGSHGVTPAHIHTLRLAASRGQFGGTFTRTVTDPHVWNPIQTFIFEDIRGGTGTWSGISGGAASTLAEGRGTLPVHGTIKFCYLGPGCMSYFSLDLYQDTKGVGIGGLITATGLGGQLRISLQAAPWTIKTATVQDGILTAPSATKTTLVNWVAKGWAHAPVSTTSSTAMPSGMLQLVTPNQVKTKLFPPGNPKKVGSFVILAIHFIPEPGLLLLLGSGVAGLALLARRKMRR